MFQIQISMGSLGFPVTAITEDRFNPQTKLYATTGLIIDDSLQVKGKLQDLWVPFDLRVVEQIFPGIRDYLAAYPDVLSPNRNDGDPVYQYKDNELWLWLYRWFDCVYVPYTTPAHFPEAALRRAYDTAYKYNVPQPQTSAREILSRTLKTAAANGWLPEKFILLEIGPGLNPLDLSQLPDCGIAAYAGLDIHDHITLPDSDAAAIASYNTLAKNMAWLERMSDTLPVIAVGADSLQHLQRQHLEKIGAALGSAGIIIGNFSAPKEWSQFIEFAATVADSGLLLPDAQARQAPGDPYNTYVVINAQKADSAIAQMIAQSMQAIAASLHPANANYTSSSHAQLRLG